MNQRYDDLIKQMPAIAKAANAFTSPDVQKSAFTALVRAHGTPVEQEANSDDELDAVDELVKPSKKKRAAASTRKLRTTTTPGRDSDKTTRRRRSTASTPTFVRDLNLRPTKGKSFVDFVAEKGSPAKNNERILLAIYWLQRVGGVKGVTIDHVYTCFKGASPAWKVPVNMTNAIAVVNNRKGWLDTSNMDDIKVAVPGENHVEHDMNATKKAA
jgi:hypothetical protein